jgi:hypothetical protein
MVFERVLKHDDQVKNDKKGQKDSIFSTVQNATNGIKQQDGHDPYRRSPLDRRMGDRCRCRQARHDEKEKSEERRIPAREDQEGGASPYDARDESQQKVGASPVLFDEGLRACNEKPSVKDDPAGSHCRDQKDKEEDISARNDTSYRIRKNQRDDDRSGLHRGDLLHDKAELLPADRFPVLIVHVGLSRPPPFLLLYIR